MVANGPGGSGRSRKARSRSPRSSERRKSRSWSASASSHVDFGKGSHEAPQDPGQQTRADALVGADAQRAGGAAGQGVDVGLRRTEPGLNRFGVSEQRLAGHREAERLLAVHTLHHSHADDPLEAGDLLADRRLRVAEPPGRTVERPLVGNRLERGEMPKLEAKPCLGSFVGVACLTDDAAGCAVPHAERRPDLFEDC